MRKILLGASALCTVIASPATAADLGRPAYVAPVVYAPVGTWTGFYVGVNIGWLVEHDESGLTNFTQPGADPSTLASNTAADTRFSGGLQAGYNYQFNSLWVVGVEFDWTWSNPSYSFCRQADRGNCFDAGNNNRGALTFSAKTDWLATVRGRLGVDWHNTLFYGTVGGAWAKVNTTLAASCLVGGCGNSSAVNATTDSFSDTKGGWVAGLGAETRLPGNWTAKIEALHYDLGSITDAYGAAPNLGSYGVSYSRNVRFDEVRVGINYKFGGYATAPAVYK